MFILWAVFLMSPPNNDGRPEVAILQPWYNVKTTSWSPHLSFCYLADKVTLTVSNKYSSQPALFLPFYHLTVFTSLNPFPSRHTIVKGYVHVRTFSTYSQSDVCGFTSSCHLLCMLYEKAIQVGKQSPVFVNGELFKNHAFSDLVSFFSQFLVTVTTAPVLFKLLKATVCATMT